LNNRYLLLFLLLLGATGARAQLTADFSADVRQGCSPIVVNFRDLSTGSPTAWHWDFGNGGTSTLQNPSATFFAVGTYSVTLTVTNNNGSSSNTVTKTAYITVLNEPTVNFSANTTTGCTPAVIQFNDMSQSPAGTSISNWEWDFGDNQTATGQNPTHIFRTAGSFTVTLKITNSAGCTTLYSKANYININPGVVPRFNFTDPGVCRAPATIAFTNNSNGPGTLSYQWDFGDGGTSTQMDPSYTFTTNNTYRVVLHVSSSLGCSDSATSNIKVGRVNTDFNFPSHICPKTPVNFMNASSPRPVSSVWRFSTGYVDSLPNARTSFPGPGTYSVTLVNTYSVCTDSLTKSFTIAPVPVAAFTASDSDRCQPPLNVSFTANAAGATGYNWKFGDGATGSGASISHNYTQSGIFTVSLIVSDSSGCSDTLSRNMIRIQPPEIRFTGLPHLGCVPDTVSMSATVMSSDSAVSWNWNFGDGSAPSNLRNPSHLYAVQGTYNVTLTITTTDGCTVTKTLNQAVQVGTPPVPAFTANPLDACADPGIQFTDQSTNAQQWIWDFGDGSGGSTQQSPLHVFTDTGYFNISLTAVNNGCRKKITKTSYVHIKPSVSRFQWKPDCSNPKQLVFIDKSLGASTWIWNFGDGTTYTGQTPPAHTFPTFGTYQVKLTTTNSSCTYTLTKDVKVYDPTPRLSVPVREGCRPSDILFNLSGEEPGIYRKFEWNYGDGSRIDTSSGTRGRHVYTVPGAYKVQVVVTDSFGCRYTIVDDSTVKVNGPRAAFGAVSATGCRGLNVTFLDSSVTSNGNAITRWTFDFGDSSRGSFTAPPLQHRYDSVGNYDVVMTVTDSKGCIDSVTRRNFVRTSTVHADFGGVPEYCPTVAQSYLNLTLSDLPFSSFWQFDDGTTSNQYNAQHGFTDTGFHRITLVVQDILGCRDSVQKDSAVHIQIPKADFTANNFTTYCTPFQAKFTNRSNFYNSTTWNFGPGMGSSTQIDPYAFYTQPGSYPVKLVITAPGGCSDSVSKTMLIKDASDARLNYSPTSGCTPLNVTFDAFSPLNGNYVWDFGDGNVVDTSINALSHLYYDYGNFLPRVILKQNDGSSCTLTLTGTQTISLLGVHTFFTLDTMLFCDGGTIRANSDSTRSNDPIVGYNWTFGDNSGSSAPNPTHTYTGPGQYDVRLVVTTQAGCTDTMVRRPVKVAASPQLIINADSVICRRSRVTYQGQYAFADTSQIQWSWTFPNGNTSGLQNPPAQVYDTPGTYTVTATAVNSSGCRDTVTQTLVIHDLPAITMPATITKFVGVPAILNATYSSGTIGWSWAPVTDLSCNDCPQPIATPKYNTLYTVTSTDSNGCHNSGQVQVLVLCQGAKVFVPNTFSPNGDGSNDIFFVQGSGLARMKSLRIFNRWGEVVFEKRDFAVNDPSIGWDGMYKGQKAAPDVYIYQLEVFCENSDVIRFEGNVALIR
jgi:gliding motility-associated-like protein